MSEPTVADLKPLPSNYQSSRDEWDVLTGDETAQPLIDAINSNEPTALEDLLSQPQWASIALSKPHIIYSEHRRREHEGEVRTVGAMPLLNLTRFVVLAGRGGRAAALSTLYAFAIKQGVKPSVLTTRWAMDRTIKSGSAAAVEAIVAADPEAAACRVSHGVMPLDLAMRLGNHEMVIALQRHGADPSPRANDRREALMASLLAIAATRKDMALVEQLLAHGCPIPKSGALHRAAQVGAVDIAQVLIERAADVNELLDKNTLSPSERDLLSTWTPLDFAANHGQEEAVKLLRSHGAKSFT